MNVISFAKVRPPHGLTAVAVQLSTLTRRCSRKGREKKRKGCRNEEIPELFRHLTPLPLPTRQRRERRTRSKRRRTFRSYKKRRRRGQQIGGREEAAIMSST